MCKPKAPDTSAQQAEAAREAQVQEQQYQQELAQQQSQWQTEFTAAQAQYQQQLQLQQAEIQRQTDLQTKQQSDAEALRQQQLDEQKAETSRGQSYSDYRSSVLDAGADAVKGAYSKYDDDYFNNFAKQFTDANRVDADTAYTRGQQGLTYKLADQNNLKSSAAADGFGMLDQDHNSAIAKIASEGSRQANNYRNQIQGQENTSLNSLYALGNQPAPTFTTDDAAAAAKSQIGKTIMGLTQNIQPVGPM